jgi:uncharacterized protein (DUF302 family)
MQEKHGFVDAQAKVDSLRKARGEGIRAHGKLKGLDVFSWMQPDQQALVNFMTAIPKSIVWVGNPAEIEAVLSGHPELLNKFQSILSFGENRTGFMLENEFDDIQDVLNDLMTELKSNGTLLFTCTENDSEYVSLKIVAYLNLVQLI